MRLVLLRFLRSVLDRPAASPASAQGEPPIHSASAATPLRLNLGCGDKHLPGYINVDVASSRAGVRPDVQCDLRELKPFAADSADELLAVHVVEHFWRWEIVDVLREWLRTLKPGGQMIVECPNLLEACRAFLEDPVGGARPGREGQRTMWVFYGDPAWRDPLMCHRWNYTPESLKAIMEEAGLVRVRQEPAQFKLREPRDMRVVGEKPRTVGAAP
jgi:SAM-dependent methyltransferase